VNIIKSITIACLFSALSLSAFAQNSSSPGCTATFQMSEVSGSSPVLGDFNKILDWNHDGVQDVISISSNGVPSISLGKSDGGFHEAVSSDYISGEISPIAMTVGYFDGDWVEGIFVANDRPDVAVATTTGVYLLTTDNYGYFSLRGTPVMNEQVMALAAVDFNEDGMSDLMALDSHGGAYTTLTDGFGGFYLPVSSEYTAGRWDENEYPTSISAGHFDGDLVNENLVPNHSPDLVVLTNLGNVVVYTSDVYGYFSIRESYIQKSFTQVIAADLNTDGVSDLVGLESDGSVWMISKNNVGDFIEPVQAASAVTNLLLDVQDFDLDGNLDFAVTSSETGSLAWLKQGTICSDVQQSRSIADPRSRNSTSRTSTISSELRTFIFRP
jgi:hypothetical protein